MVLEPGTCAAFLTGGIEDLWPLASAMEHGGLVPLGIVGIRNADDTSRLWRHLLHYANRRNGISHVHSPSTSFHPLKSSALTHNKFVVLMWFNISLQAWCLWPSDSRMHCLNPSQGLLPRVLLDCCCYFWLAEWTCKMSQETEIRCTSVVPHLPVRTIRQGYN